MSTMVQPARIADLGKVVEASESSTSLHEPLVTGM